MPNARGEITNHDVRRMRELSSEGVSQRRIAKIVGVNLSTVERYIGRHEMYGRAARYAAFVERAAAYVPIIGGAA